MANWINLSRPNLEPVMVNFDNVCYVRAAVRPANNKNTIVAFSAQSEDSILVAESVEEIEKLVAEDD